MAATPPPAAPAAVASVTPPAVAKTPAPAAVAATPPPAPVAAAPTPVAPPRDGPPEPTKPSFDIVRVNPQGDAVIAGRAAPGSQVTVTDNGKAIGKTQADATGQWALVPAAPIAPGGSELTVAAATANQQPVRGDAPVVVLVPEKPKQAGAALVASAAPVLPPPPRSTIVAPVGADCGAHAEHRGAATAASRRRWPPRRRARLGLGTVDYTDHGDIRFAGTAPAGATVRTYVDDLAAGDAAADAQGHWTLVPQGQVAVGDHRLRLDQVGRDGQVIRRIELPFERADMSPQQIAEGHIVVQPGQNLWRIARHAYGRGVQYVVIYQANLDQIRDPNLIYPGQAFAVPVASDAERGSAAMPPSSSTSR